MIRDTPAKYSLGFGITPGTIPYKGSSDSNLPGTDPRSGVIAKALHGHPIAKFLAAGAAVAVSMAVGTKMMEGGGVKLAESLSHARLPGSREWQTTLLHDFRGLQKNLDEFEGIGRVVRNGRTTATFKKAGFWMTEAEKARMAERSATGGYAMDVAEWTLRDELQQRLVHAARAIPYQMPVLYATGKVTNHIFGTEPQRDPRNKVKWYNPVDVIGDFAQQSSHAFFSMVLPGEVGLASMSHGWQKLMTYGDTVSTTQPFQGEIRNFSVSLQAALARFGHSSSHILYEAQKRSAQTTGAFANAIQEGVAARRPTGFNFSDAFNDIRTGYKEVGWRDAARKGLKAPIAHWIRTPDIVAGYHEGGFPEATRRVFPSSVGLTRGFKDQWNKIEEENRNVEAIRMGRTHYMYKGVSTPVQHNRFQSGDLASTPVEQIASTLMAWRERRPGSAYTSGLFADMRERDAYLNTLREHLGRPGRLPHTANLARGRRDPAFLDAVNKTINRVSVGKMPFERFGERYDPIQEAMHRLGLGDKQSLLDMPDRGAWEGEFQKRLETLMPQKYAQYISSRLVGAVETTDAEYLGRDYQAQLTKNIRSEWKDIYGRIVVPGYKEMAGKGRLNQELFGANMSDAAHELLIRRSAEALGLNTESVSSAVLRQQMAEAGVDTQDYHALRALLVDKKQMTKPWQVGGFNVFGLKPLEMNEALQRHFFPSDLEETIQTLNRDASNRYVGGLDSRYAGRGVFQAASGEIIDLSGWRNAMIRASDVLARNVQVPLIKVTPFDILGYRARRQMSQKPILQFESMFGTHHPATEFFTPGPDNRPLVDTMVYLRNRGSKGSVFGYRLGQEVLKAPGLYRSGPTGGEGLLARNIRLGLNPDAYTPPTGTGAKERFRKAFRMSEHQPGSIWGFLSELRHGETAKFFHEEPRIENNSAALAKKLLRMGAGKGDVRAIRNLENELRRNYGLSSKVAEGISGLGGNLERLFSVPDPDNPGNLIPLHNIRKASDMYRTVENMLKLHEEQAATDIATGNRREILGSQGFLRKTYMPQRAVGGAMDAASGQSMHATGIQRRLDEFRADIYRYLVAREDILTGGNNEIIQELLGSLDQLKAAGRIGGADYTEARAAVLSMDFNIASLNRHRIGGFESQMVQDATNTVLAHPASRAVMQDVADYEMKYIHQNRFPMEGRLRRAWAHQFGFGTPEPSGFGYRPFAGNQRNVFIPTLGSQLKQRPYRAVKSVLGISTWSDPEAFSIASIIPSHMYQRLNRYFSMLGLGTDEKMYKGPQGFFNKGLIMRRVLPAVAGAAFVSSVDRTLGGAVYGKDEYGHRQYRPLIGGAVATTIAHADVALTLGKGRRQQKREEYFGDREVAIRKGRYWPIGNQPWRGTKVMYYRPNWYQRYMSGYKYTPQTYGSPLEHLAYDYDFSPLRPFDPYHFEKKHYEDRPYPVTGEYFTGPWGPLNSILNATVGRLRKPQKLMHRDEMQTALSQMQTAGQYGMAPYQAPDINPKVATRLPTGASAVMGTVMAGDALGLGQAGGPGVTPDGYLRPFNQPYGFLGFPYGTSPKQALLSYQAQKKAAMVPSMGAGHRGLAPVEFMPGEADTLRTTGGMVQLDGGKSLVPNPMVYTGNPNASHFTGNNPYNRVLLYNPSRFDPRVMAASDPVNPGSLRYQFGQNMYETQELFGIYGFMAGTVKEALGFGPHDWHPTSPVLQSASRAYGSERAFWDLNLGGLGDFPTPSQGEYGNIEASEIARRFIPHRRREINELNPLENQLGKQYPWLPGSNYFINFHQGDPFSLIPEGELRLPGPGYERTHTLHPDATGKYGLLDQYSILGDVAPWSNEYKALDRVVRKLELSDEDKQEAIALRKQRAALNKRHNFYPYEYARSDFRKVHTKVVGFMPGDADVLRTTDGLVQLAGVRARKRPEAMQWMNKQIQPGQNVTVTYDANHEPPAGVPIPGIVQVGRHNINKELLNQEDIAFPSRKQGALENRVREGAIQYDLHALGERMAHLNTLFNTKFLPHRTALEDWERTNVYGSTFPQWSHPFRDFIKPLTFRAMNRNPLIAAGALAMVGGMFGRTAQAKTAGRVIGAGLGAFLALHSDARSIQTGTRWIPLDRRMQNSVEEYTDMLNYIKYSRLYSSARTQAVEQEDTDPEKYAQIIEEGKYKENQFTNLGPATTLALQYRRNMLGTMYGSDPYGDVINLAAGIPKRKRDHFYEFLNAPQNERAKILSTAPRLERRIYEARWGMRVEARPDLTGYFSEHELPGPGWEGYNPNVSMEDIKLKIVNHQGLDASQMGYYPQQIQQANLMNISYPNFNQRSSHLEAANRLQALMATQGIPGNVLMVPSSKPGMNVELQAGVAS